jgi:hypothetical protein
VGEELINIFAARAKNPHAQRGSRKRRRNQAGAPKIFLEIQTEAEQLSGKFDANRGKI